ncbi:response regulator transcription factor [Desulfuribacillus alkaliarsenatis]|uniref:DNA-binding response regulator n=1 Tax=Desulfuribacillus alkaliarsenatis TaxID=766136 RepID=A0A1E5G4U4_9FIRM|nr:response regulator transcription factor [Desulfuribacillus alkaliarsenatis]OEF98183.1 DNA-binding response regulator [Desulfuribacillus alkaliarsenatis]
MSELVKVLVVDDEAPMRKLIEIYLKKNGYSVMTMDSGLDAIQELKKNHYDIVILDVMMPEMNGFEACKLIRDFSKVPIIMLTARDQTLDKVKGLTIGADDYVTKPFEEIELLARIEAILRRSNAEAKDDDADVLTYKDVRLDLGSHQVFYNDAEIELTPKEFQLLQTFLTNVGKVLSREKLLEIVWGYDFYGDLRTVDSHVKNLREKLRSNGIQVDELIKTVWGVGYKLV